MKQQSNTKINQRKTLPRENGNNEPKPDCSSNE